MNEKISMIGTLPPVKGISPYTLNLLKRISKKESIDFYGFKSIYPEFLYPGKTKTDEKEPKIKNVTIYNNLTWYNPYSWIKTGFQIKTKIVHAQWWSWFLAPVYYTILKIAKIRSKKVIITIHNVKPHEKSAFKNYLNNSIINLADEYIVHSEENKKQFLGLNKTKKKIRVIPHGIIEFPISRISKRELRNKYGFSDKDKILIFFGNIRKYKGLDILIKALGLIKDEEIKLIIAGQPWENFKKYQELIDKNNLNSRIKKFLRYNSQEKVAELFKISDLAVFPYIEFEASSGAASVAQFYKKPIIASRVGGLKEIVNKDKLFEPNNIKSLSNKIIKYTQ